MLEKKILYSSPLVRDDGTFAYSSKDKADALAAAFEKPHLVTKNSSSPLETKVRISLRKLKQNQYVPNIGQRRNPNASIPAVKSREAREACDQHCDDPRQGSVTRVNLMDLVKELNRKKSPGIDGISSQILKSLPATSIDLLVRVFNACLDSSYFPLAWKIGKVVPIPKPGKAQNIPANSRPISLLSNEGKLFERIILEKLNAHAEANNLIIKQQFGFREGHSTIQQVLRITELASLNFNRNRSTGLAMLDLEKAFDSVWHEGLIHKLMIGGFPSKIVKLILSYLSDRRSTVCVDGVFSKPFAVSAGVPQGSILSPFLFNYFINDIPIDPKTKLAIYADDTALFVDVQWKNAKRVSELLSNAFNSVSKFFRDWKIKLNEGKTECIIFSKSSVMHKKSKNFPLIANGRNIDWADQVKYLGVTLDKKLNFGAHIDRAVCNANSMMKTLFPLMKRNNSLSTDNKVRVYKAMIRPILTYGCQIFNNCAKTHFQKLQKVQNKALKMATNSDWLYTRLTDLHKKADIPFIREHVDKLTVNFYSRCENHENSLVSNLGDYDAGSLNFKLKHRLPKPL